MHFVYCIYSPKFQKTYVGRTSDYKGRLKAHNHSSNKGYTKRFQPWELLFVEEFGTIQEASQREKYFKTGVGREVIQKRLESL